MNATIKYFKAKNLKNAGNGIGPTVVYLQPSSQRGSGQRLRVRFESGKCQIFFYNLIN